MKFYTILFFFGKNMVDRNFLLQIVVNSIVISLKQVLEIIIWTGLD